MQTRISTAAYAAKQRFTRLLNSPPWSLLDQILQSGSNFIVMLLLARELGVVAFGAFAIAQTYLQYANLVQNSLVVAPMLSTAPAERDLLELRRIVRGFSAYNIALSLPCATLVCFGAEVLGTRFQNLDISKHLMYLAPAITSFQVQDWTRRALYARSEPKLVFAVDLLAYGGYVTAIVAMAVTANLSVERALVSQAIIFGASGVLALSKFDLLPDWQRLRSTVQRNWTMGKDVLVSSQLQWLGSWGVMLVGSGMIGPAAAGATRAVQSLLGPLNIVLQWMENVVPVTCAQRYRDGGSASLELFLRRMTWLGAAGFGAVTVAVTIIREPLMAVAFSSEYRPYAWLLTVQGAYFLFAHLFRMQTYKMRTVGETSPLQVAGLLWAIVGLTSLPLCIHLFDAVGVLASVLAGEAAALIFLMTRSRQSVRYSKSSS